MIAHGTDGGDFVRGREQWYPRDFDIRGNVNAKTSANSISAGSISPEDTLWILLRLGSYPTTRFAFVRRPNNVRLRLKSGISDIDVLTRKIAQRPNSPVETAWIQIKSLKIILRPVSKLIQR